MYSNSRNQTSEINKKNYYLDQFKFQLELFFFPFADNPSLNDIPKTVLRPTVSVSGPSLIPLTVSEMEADEEPSSPVSSSLHMSGGGVYTTDSFYCKCFDFFKFLHFVYFFSIMFYTRVRVKPRICKRRGISF